MVKSNTPLRFPYVLFDLGSTLIYFDGDWAMVRAAALQELTGYLRSQGYALDEASFPAAYAALIREYFQKGEDTLIQYTSQQVLRRSLQAHGYPRPSASHLREAIKAYCAIGQKYWHVEEDAAPAPQILKDKGCRLGIISNAPDDQDVQTLVANAHLGSFFDFVLTSARVKVRKPAPKIFRAALDYWGAHPGQTVMVGDTVKADVAGAKRLGIASVWIPRRTNTPENHAAAFIDCPDATISALSELPALLENWPAGK